MKIHQVLLLLSFIVVLGMMFPTFSQPEPDECRIVAGGKAVACKCVGMVADVQHAHIEECEKKTPGPGSKEYAQCMEEMPDHCDIVSYPNNYGAGDHPKKCHTSCKPERCKCSDSSCRAHEQNAEHH